MKTIMKSRNVWLRATMMIVMLALVSTPIMAQRGGNSSGRSGGSSGHSSSMSSGRSGGSVSSSRSSSSSSRSSVSAPSSNRSSVSRSSSTPSRSSATVNRNSTSTVNRNHAASAVTGRNNSSTPSTRNSGTVTGNRANTARGSVATPAGRGNAQASSARNGVMETRSLRGGDAHPAGAKTPTGTSLSTGELRSPNGHGAMAAPGRYARPDRPGAPMPPSHRPMHPAPYFHHPYHHSLVHMHLLLWDPVPFAPVCWHGFWGYCNTYWYDYHVTNTVVVREYVRDNYNATLVSYCMSENIMYALIDDVDGNRYLKVFDSEDNLLAEQKISRKYVKTELDKENGGCWIFKKKDKDPMLFLYVDGELLIYEAD